MATKDQEPFKLLRRFSLLSFLAIGLVTVMSVFLFSRFLSHSLVYRDAVVTMEFTQTIVQAQEATSYFERADQEVRKAAFEDFFQRIMLMPEVVRVFVYAKDGTILWSNEEKLIGFNFRVNPDLEKAVAGELVVNTGSTRNPQKPEHVFEKEVPYFSEIYVPIWNNNRDRVVGVVEVYKVPIKLLRIIERGNRLVWITVIFGGLILYGSLFGSLFWIVHKGAFVIRKQQDRVLESKTMAAIGELALAIAYGIQNPLASIRSVAEVMLQKQNPSSLSQTAKGIIKEADRLERWVNEFLAGSRPLRTLTLIQINEVIREAVHRFEDEMERRGIQRIMELEENLPLLQGDTALLGQMFNNLITNAVEAMPPKGALTITSHAREGRSRIEVKIFDTGKGIPQDQIEEVFKPLYTTQEKRLGMGLPLARLIVERHRGTIHLSSQEGHGTVIYIQLPVSQ